MGITQLDEEGDYHNDRTFFVSGNMYIVFLYIVIGLGVMFLCKKIRLISRLYTIIIYNWLRAFTTSD
jgi:hypothetical protein